jgi:membrane protease YdiL (CAAX protease family)
MSSIGVRRKNLSSGLLLAVLDGVLVSLVNLASPNRATILDLVRSGKALWLYPVSVALTIATAATTEEVFFRGVLQTRLTALLRSSLLAVVVAATLFALFHLPYAYLDPDWPSAGDFGTSLRLAFANGLPGSLILGGVYVKAKHNLLAPIVTHAMMNGLPGMVLLDSLL